MPPIALNRRRFLGCSAAASLALSQGNLAEAAARRCRGQSSAAGRDRRRQSGHGTLASLARTARNADRRCLRPRAQTSAARAGDRRESTRSAAGSLRRSPRESSTDRTSTRSSSPFRATLHEAIYRDAIAAGKHLYAEKPLASDARRLRSLDRRSGARLPKLTVHVGFQRRSNPRFREGVELIRRGELGRLIEARATLDQQQRARQLATAAGWAAAIGRATGWSNRPCTSGTFCNGSRASCRSGPAAGAGAVCSPRLTRLAT